MIDMLLDMGADPNGVVDIGIGELRYTALVAAIQTGKGPIVHYILDHGASVNWPATRGLKRTPLQAAAEWGHLSIVRLLLQRGACVNAPPAAHAGGTALQLAAIGEFVGVAELLVDHGADVNAACAATHGRRAIDGAAEHGRTDMIYFLIQYGAKLEPGRDGRDDVATGLAKSNGHWAVVELLQSYKNSKQVSNIENDKAKGPYCKLCGIAFSKISAFKRHVRTKHNAPSSNISTKFTCDICKHSFKRNDILQRHKATRSQAGYVACPSCDKQFRKDYLKQHYSEATGMCKDAGFMAG